MKNIKNILLPLSLVAAFSMTSCNSGLARIKYENVTDRMSAIAILDTIRKKQFDSGGNFALFNAGTVRYNYSISITGDIRLEKAYTLDNINLHTNGYVNFAWDLENKYFKTDGPKEVEYITVDENGTWWEVHNYQRGVAPKKIKYDLIYEYGDDFDTPQEFANYIVTQQATYDLSTGVFIDLFIPFVGYVALIYATGLTGFVDELPEEQEGVLTPHKIFSSDEYNDFFNKLHDKYDNDHKDGHYLTEEYTEDGSNNLTCSAKGDIELSVYDEFWPGDFWFLSGPATFDTFTAWEDNFIRQSVFHLNAHLIESQINAWNLTFKIDVEQEVNKGCKIDKINFDEYIDSRDD